MLITLFFHTPILYLTTMDKLSYQISTLSPDRLCIEISVSGQSLGLVYYERAKRGYTNKPVSMNRWLCVDAKVEGLYTYGGDNITPKDILDKCQEIISSL
jgi:hypothetical protein